MKKFLEKAVKWLLTASGFVTSVVILLIIGFLFTEGAGLFREPVVEEGGPLRPPLFRFLKKVPPEGIVLLCTILVPGCLFRLLSENAL